MICQYKSLLILLIAILAIFAGVQQSFAGAPNRLVNPGLRQDLTGWTAQGAATMTTAAPLPGGQAVRLGPGKASISQRYDMPGLRVVWLGATVQAGPPGTAGALRIQCFDAGAHLLMDTHQDIKPDDAAAQSPSIYFKTQAHTAYVILSLENDGPTGTLYVCDASLYDFDRDDVYHAPLVNLTQMMRPIWQGQTVFNETVLMESDGGRLATGTLLFTPTRILSVRNYGLSTAYTPGRDYTLAGKTLTVTPNTRMPLVKNTDFPTGNFPWFTADGKHVVVTYTHADRWQGPTPQFVGALMPRTEAKLRHHQPLTVVADGDSITFGDNTSGTLGIAPYMPTWAELFVDRLKQASGDSAITLYNTALGGATAQWGADNADSAVAALHPDLVIIAFGMNDFSSVSPADFQTRIQEIITRVRARSPQAEFILVASMRYDPAYTSDPADASRLAGYVTTLRALTGPGIQMLDMYGISDALFRAKKPKDLIGNPLHPNDFLARWYAQGLAAMLVPQRK
jgi:lysophospholipase L1-like esterase